MFHTQLAQSRNDASLAENHASSGEKYLLVASRGALYAMEVAHVREVHALPALHALPQSPQFVAGVVNVRGEVLPVVDLAARLGQKPRVPQLGDGLVVLQTPARRVALWVEAVRDLAVFAPHETEVAPFAGEHSLISQVAHHGEDVVFLLQTSRLLESETEIVIDHSHIETEIESETVSPDENPGDDAVFRARAQRLALLVPEISSQNALLQNGSSGAEVITEASTVVARVVIGGEERGLALAQVREFCALENFAPVPCCPPHIVGQMNLRGEVVTLLDIAPHLGLVSSPPLPFSGQVVVANVRNASAEAGLVGIVIEKVSDVLSVREHEMRAVPASSRAAETLCGAILHDERWIPVLDLPAILSDAVLVVDETI